MICMFFLMRCEKSGSFFRRPDFRQICKENKEQSAHLQRLLSNNNLDHFAKIIGSHNHIIISKNGAIITIIIKRALKIVKQSLPLFFSFTECEIVNSMSVDTSTGGKKASLAKMAAVSANSASTRNSSVSSMASMSSHGSFNSSNLNHALAMVNNQLDREQRKQDQEATRKLTLLRQRKISAVLKVR